MKHQKTTRPLAPVRQSGFSLIEIMLVVGIMAFLATMVAVNVFKDREKANQKNAKTGVQMISAKASSFYLDTGSAPTKMDDLLTKPGNVQNWRGPYLTQEQSLDPWGMPYVLKAPGDHSELDVISYGADKKEGGSENGADIGNW